MTILERDPNIFNQWMGPSRLVKGTKLGEGNPQNHWSGKGTHLRLLGKGTPPSLSNLYLDTVLISMQINIYNVYPNTMIFLLL